MKNIIAVIITLMIMVSLFFVAYADQMEYPDETALPKSELSVDYENSEDAERDTYTDGEDSADSMTVSENDDIGINLEVTEDLLNNSSEEKLHTTFPSAVVLAIESPFMCIDDRIVNIWDRPYVYNETTYVPLRVTAEGMGALVGYNEENRLITVEYKGNGYAISADDERVSIFYGVSFIPLREMCLYLGITVNWYDGIITLSDDGYVLEENQVVDYKSMLGYSGFTDAYFLPRTVVNPYVKYTYEQMNEDIKILGKMYPEIIRDIHSIGKSGEGRDIPAFYLGKGSKIIVMCASMHAREYIATNFLMYIVDSYANGYVNDISRNGYSFRETLDEFSFLIVPMVNPDGINIVQNGFDSAQNAEYVKSMPHNSYGSQGWKATAFGVDLNNNFDWLWYNKGAGPSSEGYGGPYAASESETQAMQNLINNTDFLIFASFHTQGQVVYWMDPNCDQGLIEKHSTHISRLCDEIGFTKMPSDGSVGYSGYMTDYVRYYKKTMAMTIEMCPYVGDYPYPESDFDKMAYPARNIGLILADIAKQL